MKNVLLMIGVIFISGCGVSGNEYKSGEEKCKNNGGVAYIMSDFSIKVNCNVGARFVY